MTDTLARALATADDHTIDRRKLLKMGVWAAPVVVLANAAPAAAASPDLTVTATTSRQVGATTTNPPRDTIIVSTDVTVNKTATLIVVLQIAESGVWAAGIPNQDNISGESVTKTIGLAAGTTKLTFPKFTRSNNGKKPSVTLTYKLVSGGPEVLPAKSVAW
ncbi:hypothetical protein ACFVSU_15275 [Microbacterium sp. NPDC058062]|uniref:hypothetical protein n=1 Tax=Microbacterium sp. NPDC058062 TaxID=3346320 RepID=UPI0036D9FBED